MCHLFIALLFSLALGPNLKLLNAQTVNYVTSNTGLQNGLSSHRDEPKHLTPTQETTMRTSGEEISTMGAYTTEATNVEGTSGMPTRTLPTTPELLLTTEPPFSSAATILATYSLSTSAVALEFTSKPEQQEQKTTMIVSFTSEPPQTMSPSPALPVTPLMSTKPFVSTPSLTTGMETDTSPATTPLPPNTSILTTTTRSASVTPSEHTIPTTTSIAVSTEVQTMLMTFLSTISTHSNEIISSTSSSAGKGNDDSSSSRNGTDPKKGTKWLVVGAIVMVLFCILMTLCLITVFIRRRKQSGKQNFGYMNGQRSKKKKGVEDDVWAGPVKLGGDCESPEEGDIQGQEKMDGVEVTGLSTFATLEENGGVGRPGSPEAKNWEEKEPLLYIDEEGKEKPKEEGKSDEEAKANEGTGEKDGKEAEPIGEETFCLTTAV